MASELSVESLPILDPSESGAGSHEGDADDHHRQHDRFARCLRQTRQLVHILRHVLMLLANIVAWYATNGMNGIAMQKAAVSLREEKLSFLPIFTNTALVTAVQLLLGACLGRVLLYVYSFIFKTKPISVPFTLELLQPAQILLALLHSTGSISTNLGKHNDTCDNCLAVEPAQFFF